MKADCHDIVGASGKGTGGYENGARLDQAVDVRGGVGDKRVVGGS